MSSLELRTEPIKPPVAFDPSVTPQTVITMSEYVRDSAKLDIRLAPAECASFAVGHRVHFIQLKMGIGKPMQPVNLLKVEEPNKVVLSVGNKQSIFYHHHISEFQPLLEKIGETVPGWLHEKYLIAIQGYMFSVSENLPEEMPCI